MGTDICFPVSRYSHAIGLRADKSVDWSHISSSTLFVILKGSDGIARDEKLTLRVVQATEVLESLDVAGYIDNAVRARRSVIGTGATLYMEQLPIFGITKETILAIRYTQRDGQARRLQFRMHSVAECRRLVETLALRGMEFTEQRPGSARPATAGPQITTPQSSSPYFHDSQQPPRHPFTPQVIEAGSLSQAGGFRSQHHPGASQNVPFQQQYPEPEGMPPPKLFSRDETSAPRQVSPTRPATGHFFRSATIQSRPSQFDSNDIVHQAHREGLARPSSTSNTAAADALSQAVDHYQSPQASNGTRQNLSTVSLQSEQTSLSSEAEAAARLNVSKHPSRTERTPTSSSFVFPETLEHEIPPRRELPFARPTSRRSDSPASRPRSALTLPPLPKPKLSMQKSATGEGQSSRPVSPARPQTSSPLKRSIAEADTPEFRGEQSTTNLASSKTLSPARVPSPEVPSKKRSRMEELLNDRKTLLEKSSANRTKRHDSMADAPGEPDEWLTARNDRNPPTLRHDSLSPVKHATSHDPTINAYNVAKSAGQRDDNLAQYAAQSLQDRQAALDTFMVQCLEDPNFVQLCRDVGNCWRRIALGL